MADPSAAERAYQRLKHDILNGAVPIGPLDIRGLGDRLRMSVTPIREALARLSAERLVKLAPHHGYTVATPSARLLQHLYELIAALIDLSLERTSASRCVKSGATKSTTQRGPIRYVETMASLMREIASAQTNLELTEHIFSLNDRLFPARRCEPRLFTGADEEAAALIALWDSRSYDSLRIVLRKHHEVRVERVDALARLLAEQADDA